MVTLPRLERGSIVYETGFSERVSKVFSYNAVKTMSFKINGQPLDGKIYPRFTFLSVLYTMCCLLGVL
jgi:hypothetical protein